jgi:hypothetical protein
MGKNSFRTLLILLPEKSSGEPELRTANFLS